MSTEMATEEGYERSLTFGEIVLARSVFGNSIFYDQVLVHCDSYFPFGLQGEGYAMAPNGELWFRKTLYANDYSRAGLTLQHTFIHEMAHVWQHQKGMWVRLRGLLSKFADYRYRFDDKKMLKNYTLEQQASIIADYWFLKTWGYRSWLANISDEYIMFRGVTDKDIISKYEYVLSDFLRQR